MTRAESQGKTLVGYENRHLVCAAIMQNIFVAFAPPLVFHYRIRSFRKFRNTDEPSYQSSTIR